MSDTNKEREAFEKDAGPYGFDLLRDYGKTSGEPWAEYLDDSTGHRWGGWLAHAQQEILIRTGDDKIDAIIEAAWAHDSDKLAVAITPQPETPAPLRGETYAQWRDALSREDIYNFDSEGRGYKKDSGDLMRMAFEAGQRLAAPMPQSAGWVSDAQVERLRVAIYRIMGGDIEPTFTEAKAIAEEVAMLTAPLALAPGLSGWQEIASAPKDGTGILLGFNDEEVGGFVGQGRWHEEDPDGPDNMGHDAGFMDDQYGFFKCARSFGAESYRSAGLQPTHWQPLPAAPGIAPHQPQPEEAIASAAGVVEAWDSTVLPKANDGMMQERMEDLRAVLSVWREECEKAGAFMSAKAKGLMLTEDALQRIGGALESLAQPQPEGDYQRGWKDGNDTANKAHAVLAGEPLFWVRLLRDNLYEGPVHHKSEEGRLLREAKPDEWRPLYLQPQPEPASKGVTHQWRKKGTGPWWDGYPDHSDGDGPYETRTLYANPNEPVEVSKLAVYYYWTPKPETGWPTNLATWSQNPGPHKDWDVVAYVTLESANAAISSQQRETQEAAGYLDGVNVDRLRKALTKMGCSSGAGEEDAASRLAELVNRLTLSVERFALSAPQEAEKRRDERETFEAHMHGYSLARDGDGYIDWNTRSAWWVWQASASIDRAPLATPPSAMRAALVETEAVLSADDVYPELHKMVRAALSAPQEAGKPVIVTSGFTDEMLNDGTVDRLFMEEEAGKVEAVADEREAFIAWLGHAYPTVYDEADAAQYWRQGHVSALAWAARASLYLRPSQQALSDEQISEWALRMFEMDAIDIEIELRRILAAAGGSEK